MASLSFIYRYKIGMGRFVLAAMVLCSRLSFAAPIPYLSLDTFFYSAPVSVEALASDWDGAFRSGDRAVTFDRLEAGVAWDGWRFGALYRYDYSIRFTSETAEIVHAYKNKLALTPGKDYPLYIDADGYSARGVRLSRQFVHSNNLSVGASVSLLRGAAFTSGRLRGEAVALLDKDYDLNFDVNYSYSEDTLFDRQVTAPAGSGYGVDLALSWQVSDQLSVSGEVVDLFGVIKWQDAPFTKATGDSENKRYDEEGYVVYDPVISGIEGYHDFSQPLRTKFFANARYLVSPSVALLIKYQDYGDLQLVPVGLGYRWSHIDTDLLYEGKTESWWLRFSGGPLVFQLASDSWHLDTARTLSLNCSYQLAF